MKQSNRYEIGKYIKKTFLSYIYPYFLFCTINYMLTMCILLLTDKVKALSMWKTYIWGILYSKGGKEWMPNCSPLWFLTALFCALIILYFVMKLKKSVQHIFVLLLLICSAVLAHFSFPKFPWNIDTALLGVAFCYLGIMLARGNTIYHVRKLSSLWKGIVIILCFIVGIVFIILNTGIDEVNLNGCIYGNYIFMLLGAFFVSISLILVTFISQEYENKVDSKGDRKQRLSKKVDDYVLWIGRHTILVMAFDNQSSSVAVRAARKLLGGENWAFESVLKIIIISIVIVCWGRVIEWMPEKAKKMLTF